MASCQMAQVGASPVVNDGACCHVHVPITAPVGARKRAWARKGVWTVMICLAPVAISG
ncbi:MAG TPA: hypothetical protein PLB25_01045 [Rhodoferax sp.]|nr:hypothetical protein [Rhodoferax sp.]